MFKKTVNEKVVWALQFLKKYLWALFGIVILQFGQNYAFTMLPKVSTNFIFELFTPENFNQIYKYFFLAILIIIINGALGYINTYSLSLITENAANKMRIRLFERLIYLPLNYFKRQKTGNFIIINIDDISKIRFELFEGIVRIVSQSIFVILIIVKLILLNYRLTLISFAIIPVMYVLLKTLGNKLRDTSAKLQQNISNISTNLHETLTAIEVVKTFAKENHEIEKFSRTSNSYKKISLKLKVLHNLFKPLNDFLFFFFGFILIGIAGFFIIKNQWTVKGLSEYLMLLGILFTPLSNIPKTLANFKVVSASIDRVYNIVKEENRLKENPEPIRKKIEGQIEFERVYFGYDDIPVLKNINFYVNKGDVLAFVGPSGAGKTTIINLIPRLYDVNSGTVKIDGINVKDYSIKNLRSQIGIVSQNIILFNDTVYENIRYARQDAQENEIIEAAKKAHAYEFIMKLPEKFNTKVGERGTRLSGGEKQRIAIARTVLTNPQILILDEATSSLDSESEYYIQIALNELMEGKTSIVIAHRLSTINHANNVLVIDKGEIIAAGTHVFLLKHNTLYNKLYNLQYFR